MYQNQNIYFASANTANGFISHFSDIFDSNSLEHIYILKGGPGTGKSTFLRAISKAAKEREYTVEEFICSSDPNSLDGVIIRDISAAIVDGTSPHTFEPLYPGAVENIVNLGTFWDGKKLYNSRTEIMESIKEKKRCFNRAYQFLRAYGEIEGEIYKLGQNALIKEKMKKSIERISKNFLTFKKGNFSESIRLIESFCCEGIAHLDSFICQSEDVFIIEDTAHTAYEYLSEIYQEARKKNLAIRVSYSEIFQHKINGICFPDLKISFTIGKRNYEKELKNKKYHYINMKRFIDLEEIRQNKQKIRFGKKCSEMLLDGATEALGQSLKLHQNLEKMYIEAMDFIKLNQYINEFTDKMFG
jgi:hypothetical protein